LLRVEYRDLLDYCAALNITAIKKVLAADKLKIRGLKDCVYWALEPIFYRYWDSDSVSETTKKDCAEILNILYLHGAKIGMNSNFMIKKILENREKFPDVFDAIMKYNIDIRHILGSDIYHMDDETINTVFHKYKLYDDGEFITKILKVLLLQHKLEEQSNKCAHTIELLIRNAKKVNIKKLISRDFMLDLEYRNWWNSTGNNEKTVHYACDVIKRLMEKSIKSAQAL
jgi:hypothetical protein